MQNPRQLAFIALRSVRKGAFTDVALDRALQTSDLNNLDRSLVTELVYGSVRRQRTLDALVDRLAKQPATEQPPDLRTILHLGLYQLRYLDRVPASAAVNTTVQLAKENQFKGLSGFVNALLRQYIRLAASADPLQLPQNPVERLGIVHGFPNWIVEMWLEQLGLTETEQLCEWMNQSPTIDLRVNLLRTSLAAVETAMRSAGVSVSRVPYLPQALRLSGTVGAIEKLPGFKEGWWTVQDSSAQLVSYLLDPQPGETVIDACAAPGGKTTHIAELMGDKGTVWACDRAASRLKKLQENADRLSLKSIQVCIGDSRNFSQFTNKADRVLLDAPCSGTGTLHRRVDARWRQTKETVTELSQLQRELLARAATWVKPGGVLVYATCTLNPVENQSAIREFLAQRPNWQITPPPSHSLTAAFTATAGWIQIWPHRYQMDGFFMVRLQLSAD